MSKAACAKEILCAAAEAAAGASKYGEFIKPEELIECTKAAEDLSRLRIKLANRKDRAEGN